MSSQTIVEPTHTAEPMQSNMKIGARSQPPAIRHRISDFDEELPKENQTRLALWKITE
jgi:hypothetical protein